MKDSAIQLVDIVQQFHKLASVGVMASASEWNELWRAMAAEQPEFVAWLQTIRGELMERNRNLCLLVRLGFEPYEMINLLGMGATNLCNIRRRLLKRLFGIDGTTKAFDKRVRELALHHSGKFSLL